MNIVRRRDSDCEVHVLRLHPNGAISSYFEATQAETVFSDPLHEDAFVFAVLASHREVGEGQRGATWMRKSSAVSEDKSYLVDSYILPEILPVVRGGQSADSDG